MAKETKQIDTNEPKQPERVSVMLPVVPGEADTVFVGLNGKGYIIQRGVSVMVPRAVADQIYESQARKQAQLRRMKQLEEEARKPRVAGM